MNPGVTFISCFLSIFLCAIIFGGEHGQQMDPTTLRYVVGIGVGVVVGLVILLVTQVFDFNPFTYFARKRERIEREKRNRDALSALKDLTGPPGPQIGY